MPWGQVGCRDETRTHLDLQLATLGKNSFQDTVQPECEISSSQQGSNPALRGRNGRATRGNQPPIQSQGLREGPPLEVICGAIDRTS
eukprot:2983015-Pyramimonas_sp.AAC.1